MVLIYHTDKTRAPNENPNKICLFSACIRGGRLPYLWVGIVLHGLVVEGMCYALPDVDNFWHSQTLVIFFGRRLPLHIICLCKVCYFF